MATLNELVYDIRTLVRDNKSDDLQFTDRQIAFWIRTLRSRLIKERLDKKKDINSSNYQTLKNVAVEETSPFDDLTLEFDCPITKTKLQLPSIMEQDGKPLVKFIRGLSTFSKIPIIPKTQAIRLKNTRYSKNLSVGFIEDNYLYFIGNDLFMDEIAIEAVFDNPIEAEEYKTGEPYDYNTPYPMDQNMVDVMNELILNKNLELYIRLPEDRENDAQTAY